MSNKEAIENMINIRNSLKDLRDTVINYEEICTGKRNRIICGAYDIVYDIEQYNSSFYILLRNWRNYVGEELINRLNHIVSELCLLSADILGSRKLKKRHIKWLKDLVCDSDGYETFEKVKAFIKETEIVRDKLETERLNEVWKKTKLDFESIALEHYPKEGILQMVYEKWNENYGLLCKDYITSKSLEEHLKDMEE